MSRNQIVLVLAAALWLSGCVLSTKDRPSDHAFDEPEPISGAMSADVESALLPPLTVTSSAHTPIDPYQRRYDIDVTRVSAPTFFKGLVEGTPYNMIVDPKVSGRITLQLRSVTISEVMDSVREAYGYEYRRTGNRYLVLPAGMQTRVFQVNYLNFTRKGQSRTRVTSGQITEGGDSGSDSGDGTGVAGGVESAGQSASHAGSQIQTDSDSDFWSELRNTLGLLIPNSDGRKVILSPESSLVIIRAMPNELRDAERYLHTVQSNMDRQVILEAKILEVELSDGFQAGINWAALNVSGNNTTMGGVVGGNTAFRDGFTAIGGSGLNVTPGNPVTGFASSAIGGAFVLAFDNLDFSTVIELLETQGDVQVLSSPRVSTVNNQKAVIKVGSDEFFVTGVSSDTTAGAATTTSREVELTPFFSGIALDVTPQISPQGDVILHVHPTVSEVTDQTKNLIISGATESLPLALSKVRESDAIVRARSGQVIVIGGLMETSRRDQRLSTPFLGRIPLIGGLFRQTSVRQVKSELIILLKPQVIASDDAWDQIVDEARHDINQMGGFSESRSSF